MDLKEFLKSHDIPLEDLGDIGEVSDGYHTFNSLYNQRLYLFAALVNTFPTLSWKSKHHFNGEEPFGGGWFVVGIHTEQGDYTYHYELKDWDLFNCPELENAPQWDGHTEKDVGRLLSLSKATTGWAENEINLACQSELEGCEKPEDAQYGIECYKSALRAYNSLSRDGHSGMSIQITKSILNRLIDNKVLTPINNTDDIWEEVPGMDDKPGTKHYWCKRMHSLWKKIKPDGSIVYSDTNRVNCVNIDSMDVPFTSGLATQFVDKLFPITFPYLPASKKYTIVRDEFLYDPKNGDYDTVAFLYVITPEGEKVEINRHFKELAGKLVPIDKAEYDRRKMEAGNRG